MERRERSHRQGVRREWKQRLSSVMAVILTISMVLNTPLSWSQELGISNAYASASNAKKENADTVWATASNARYKQGNAGDVDIYVIAEDNEIVPGNTTSMTLYLRNNTTEVITDGVLKFKGNHIEKENGFFTDLHDSEGSEAPIVINSGANAAAEITSGEDLIYREEGLDSEALESAAALEQDGLKTADAEKTDVEMDVQEEEEREAAEWEAEFGDSEDEETEDEELYILTDIELQPGELYEVGFEFYTEDDEEQCKANIKFKFEGDGVDSEKKISGEEKFYYSIGLPYVNVELADGIELETGITHEMNIWMAEPSWVDSEEEVEAEINLDLTAAEDEEEDTEELASPSDRKKASTSNAKKASSSDAEKDTIKVTAEEKEKIEKYAEEAMAIKESKVSYEVTVYGTSYKKFRPKKAEAVENVGWISCLYEFANEAQPGIYYGKVTATGKWDRKGFTTEQGYLFEVTGEGTITLESKLNGTIVEVTGPASSFPEADKLEVQVSEVEEEQMAQVNEALEKKSQEEGLAIRSYKALDIKLIADGEETEPVGPISVAFKNLKLEENAAASEISLMAEDEIAADGSETGAESEAENSTGETNGEIKVFHLDEAEVVANEMVSNTEENGTVVMETDHFSVYIIAATGEGNVEITVEHYATVEAIKDNAQLIANPGGETAHVEYEEKEIQVYSSDTLVLTQLKKYVPEELSKLCQYSASSENSNYTATGVDVYHNGKWSGVTSLSADKEFSLSAGDIVRIIYQPNEKDDGMLQPVEFYDYNVTDGKLYDKDWWRGEYKESNSGTYVYTANAGINSQSSVGDNDKRLAVGQYQLPTYHSYSSYVNKFRQEPMTGLVSEVSKDGPVYTSEIWDDGLFNGTPRAGKHVINDYQLKFKQIGDTYILKDVVNGSGSSVMCNSSQNNLDVIRFIVSSGNGNLDGKIYGNNFWPLDHVDYYSGRDPLFGDGTYISISATSNRALTNKLSGSDDGEAHNWYFGMRYDFEFQLGDYVGPLNYYFLGDDDFWLFVDGTIEHGADLGGIHSSQGTTVNLGYLLEEVNEAKEAVEEAVNAEEKAKAQKHLDELKNKKHSMTIIYAERGGIGSCCYMQFTLPNVTSKTFDEEDTTSVTVNKVWLGDHEEDRPFGIQVQLSYRKDGSETFIPYGNSVTLNSNGDWSYTWDGLPTSGYDYKVEEATVPNGYQVSYSNDGIAQQQSDGSYTASITNTRVTTLAVEKIWNDSMDSTNRLDAVRMQLYWKAEGNGTTNPDGEWQLYTETDPAGKFTSGIITLTSDNQTSSDPVTWKTVLDNLPGSMKVAGIDVNVTYTVRELDGTTPLEQGGNLSGKGEASYQVSYETTSVGADEKNVCTIQVTNTLESKLMITKVKEGTDNRLGNVGFTLYAADSVEENGAVTLTQGNQIDEFTTDQNGQLTLAGLYPESGTYLLVETTPLPGYRTPNPWLIEVSDTGAVTAYEVQLATDGTMTKGNPLDVGTDNKLRCYTITIENQAGAELPETGGPGLGLIKEYGWMLVLLSMLMAGMELPIYGARKRRKEEQ